jgi:hypothetical protein
VGSLAALQAAAPLDCRVSEAVSPEVRSAARPFPVLLRSVQACEDEPYGSTQSRLIGASAIGGLGAIGKRELPENVTLLRA